MNGDLLRNADFLQPMLRVRFSLTFPVFVFSSFAEPSPGRAKRGRSTAVRPVGAAGGWRRDSRHLVPDRDGVSHLQRGRTETTFGPSKSLGWEIPQRKSFFSFDRPGNRGRGQAGPGKRQQDRRRELQVPGRFQKITDAKLFRQSNGYR